MGFPETLPLGGRRWDLADRCLVNFGAVPPEPNDGGGDVNEVTRTRGKRQPNGAPVVDRALALLDCFDADHRYLTLAELSRRSGIPASSALRLATRLVAWGALERVADGSFCVGVRLYEVGSLAPRGRSLRDVALPYMGDLAEATRQHVLLAVRQGDEAILIERLSGQQAIPTLYEVGGRLPLHSTGVGLILLAYADDDFRRSYLDQPLSREPEHTPIDPVTLDRTLVEARRQRSVTFHRLVPTEILSVAVPVFGADDSVIAAVSEVVPETQMDPRLVIPALTTVSRAISRALGARRSVRLTTPRS
jgi:DNA-binding IclR family transcriptional regulator